MIYPRVTISILNFNGANDTINCLKSLLKTDYPNFKVIVADNGSKVNEIKTLQKNIQDKRITFLRFNKNYGFTGGNNRVLKLVTSKYFVLLNNDTTVTPSWLKKLVKIMEEDATIAVAQPKILSLKNKKSFDYAGACGGFIDIFGYPFTRGRIFDSHENDHGQYDTMRDIFWSSGAAMIIRRNTLSKVGFLDERFFNYMEEIDLCFRLHNAGYRIVCNPKAVIYHKGAATASKNMFKKRLWEHRNNLLMILKNYPRTFLFLILPIRLLFEITSFFYYLSTGKFIYSLSVLASGPSALYILLNSKNQQVNRKNILSGDYKNLIIKKSVVWDYFVLKKRTFKDICRTA